ncbi:hypothetical protein [Roseococcus sp.]|uniref:hypothetical protein n=1 Tax=Roseococcus sp. TaxID=2109646 RepID=UPI003BAC4B86
MRCRANEYPDVIVAEIRKAAQLGDEGIDHLLLSHEFSSEDIVECYRSKLIYLVVLSALTPYLATIVGPESGSGGRGTECPRLAGVTVMDDDTSNTKAIGVETQWQEPDAHGHAALLLVESLIHLLVERSGITLTEAVEVVDVAEDVSREIIADRGGQVPTMARSAALLATISSSLKTDFPNDQG